MRGIKKVIQCRICGATNLYDFFDLGNIPIPNGFLTNSELKQTEKRYPLVVCLCNNCFLVQLRYIVNPSIMFKNYLYIPSSSQTRLQHFRSLAEDTVSQFRLSEKSLVVDIGSNDGSLLNSYKNLGVNVLGVDPAENLVTVAQLNGIPTVQAYISQQTARRIVKQHGKASLALATNVVAHIDNLTELLTSLDILLTDDGVFVSQFPYLLDLLEQKQFDTIYHEHLSYFSVNPLLELAKRSKLEIFDIQRNDLDGGSIRVYWKKKKSKKHTINKQGVKNLIALEKKKGLYEQKTYERFSKEIQRQKEIVQKKLRSLRDKGKHIVGYGAAAKGNILLNYFGIDKRLINYLVDSTPYKQGKYSPGVHIPITEEEVIYKTNPDYLLILAWNFKKEIIQKNTKYKRSGGKFIVLVPQYQVI